MSLGFLENCSFKRSGLLLTVCQQALLSISLSVKTANASQYNRFFLAV